jgi:hypothetical protein
MARVRYGTYSVEAEAATWGHVMLALELLAARRRRDGFPGLAEDVQRSFDRLRPQVMSEDGFGPSFAEVEKREAAALARYDAALRSQD